jgi:Zn-dependent protease/CBS domain-containing protein
MLQRKPQVTVGRIWGIPIGLDWTWFLIFGLVTWSLAATYFPREYPALGIRAYWILGAITALLMFGSVLVHELAHAWVALRNGIPVRGITLHIFGGVAMLERDARTPGAEFRIAVAGPLSSLALAAGFFALYLLDRRVDALAAPSIWLARINLMLALFNMIPGFPLDGGRILRAGVWWATGSQARATRFATWGGQLVAFGFLATGIYLALSGNVITGIWLVFIGWFLRNAAATYQAQAGLEEALRGLTVERIMRRDVPHVSGRIPLDRFVRESVLGRGQRFSVVGEEDRTVPRGLISITAIRDTPEASWDRVTVGEIMVPWDRVVRVDQRSDLLDALQLMESAGVTQVPVTGITAEGEQVLGIISREEVRSYLRARHELRRSA